MKRTETSQNSPGASAAAHDDGLTRENAEPLTATAVTLTGAVPVLVMRTLRVGYRPPSVCGPKSRLTTWGGGGDNVSRGTAGEPVPDKLTSTCGSSPLVRTLSVAVRTPTAVGVKATSMVHSAPGVRAVEVLQVVPVVW